MLSRMYVAVVQTLFSHDYPGLDAATLCSMDQVHATFVTSGLASPARFHQVKTAICQAVIDLDEPDPESPLPHPSLWDYPTPFAVRR